MTPAERRRQRKTQKFGKPHQQVSATGKGRVTGITVSGKIGKAGPGKPGEPEKEKEEPKKVPKKIYMSKKVTVKAPSRIKVTGEGEEPAKKTERVTASKPEEKKVGEDYLKTEEAKKTPRLSVVSPKPEGAIEHGYEYKRNPATKNWQKVKTGSTWDAEKKQWR